MYYSNPMHFATQDIQPRNSKEFNSDVKDDEHKYGLLTSAKHVSLAF
jgi:hypothetical protein